MQIKIVYEFGELTFDVINDTIHLEETDTLLSLITSLNGFVFLNKNKPFNELVKLQQKHQKYILVDGDTFPLDNYRYISKIIYNFLVLTNQTDKFILDNITFKHNDTILKLFGIESLVTKFESITVSPTIRADWSNPILIEKIIKL